MSRISSRAEFGVELGELSEVDGLDQGAEDHAFGLVVALGVPRCRLPWEQSGAMRIAGRCRACRRGAGTSGAPNPAEGMGERPPSTIAGAVVAPSARGCAAAATDGVMRAARRGLACAGSSPLPVELERLPNTSHNSEL